MTGPSKITRKDQPWTDPAAPSSPALAGTDVSGLQLIGRTATATIGPSITTCKLERTIDGASTLTPTVNDPDLSILNSDAIKGANPGDLYAQSILDNLVFALAGISLQSGRQLQLTLEDNTIHELRKQIGALTMTRSQHNTRARFLKRLCDDIGVEFVCPELDDPQPIQTQAQATAAKQSKARKPGIVAGTTLTVGGQAITSAQLQVANTLLQVGQSSKAGQVACEAIIYAAIGETKLGADPSTYVPNNAGCSGVLQQKNSPDPTDTAAMATLFFKGGGGFQGGGAIALSQTVSDPVQIAVRVEVPSIWPANQYATQAGSAAYLPEAKAIVAAYAGGNLGVLGAGAAATVTVTQPYQFARGATEDSWTCMRRLADEVQWYLFVVNGAVHYYSPGYLMATSVGMLVKRGADGIDQVTTDYMTSPKHDDTITVTCRAHVWDAEPGVVAQVDGYGPVDGRWLTSDIVRQSMASATTTVTLARPQKAVAEPAPTVTTTTASGASAITAKTGMQTPTAEWNPQRKPIANWIVPILNWAAANGWTGTVTSGYRTNAEQLAAASSYAASLGKTVSEVYPDGPLASNHCKVNYPGGAVDVTDAPQLASVLKGYPNTPTLVWGETTIEDGVHFSANGR